MMKLEKGKLLIAEPSIDDNYFFKSIIMIMHHNKDESIGLIINKKTTTLLSQLIDGIDQDFPIYIGGPVATNSIHYIHTVKEIKNSNHISGDFYWGGDFNSIKNLIKNGLLNKKNICFFIGYSGWGKNQLHYEISKKDWILKDNDLSWDKAFLKSDKLWPSFINQMSENYAIWANMPDNPELN